MSKQIVIDESAEAELDDALAWYSSRNPDLRRELLDAFGAAPDRIEDFPRAFPKVEGVEVSVPTRRCLLHRFPYQVIFSEFDEEIRVIAFAHTARRYGYWAGRH